MAAMLQEDKDRLDFKPILRFSRHELKSHPESRHDNGEGGDGDESPPSPPAHLRDTKLGEIDLAEIKERGPIS